MSTSLRKLVLLPGMDGTGELFAGFVDALPSVYETIPVRYPADLHLDASALTALVESVTRDAEPFVLLAESFSTPVAIDYAAAQPPNLKALIICAGFASSPVHGLRRIVVSLLSPLLVAATPPEWAVRYWLLGQHPPRPLLVAVRKAISSVKPRVLAGRLRAILGCDARAALGQTKVPILYLQGIDDRLGRL
jgi:pimeloyl-[acyl-carrier protein] methyl ester esterase